MNSRFHRRQKLLWLGVLAFFVLVAGFLPAARWRSRAIERKLSGRLPHLSWVDLGAGLVPGSAGADMVRGRIQPIAPSWIKALDLPRDVADEGWHLYPIFDDSTIVMERFESHLSVLGAGKTPHPLHQHPEEELILIVSGEALITYSPGETADASAVAVGPRQIVYHPAGQFHTIAGMGPEAVVYLVFKWRGPRSDTPAGARGTKFFDATQALKSSGADAASMITHPIFSFPTRQLDKLHCHVTVLHPDGGYAPHRDHHEIAIFVIEGTIVTLGERIGANSVIFYGAHQDHGMKNVGSDTAKYIVFEFHGERG